MPSTPQTTRVAGFDVAQLAAEARARRSMHDRGVHALVLDLDPLAADADLRAVVGRRVEVVGRAAVAVGARRGGVLGPRDAAAERDQLLEDLGRAPPAPAR